MKNGLLNETRYGLKTNSSSYLDGWHGIGPCPRRPPAFCRIRVWPPCPPARTPAGVRLAGKERGGPPTRSIHFCSEHKVKKNVNARFLQKIVTFPAKIRQKANKKISREKIFNKKNVEKN
jgi:hypothetical protein